MPLAGLSLLAPWGLLACALALVPLAVLALAFARQRRVAATLGLEPEPMRRVLRAAALPVAACLALGVAAAHPVLTTTTVVKARTASEVVFVTDVSRSMLASRRAGGPSRLDAARAAVARLRAAVPGVPAGISGLTDRILPYAFPTLDRGVFAETLGSSVRVDAPPPQEASTVATTFAPLAALVRDGFFSPGATHRTCVLVTDGESRSGAGSLGGLAGDRGCRLLVVRVGAPSDRIYGANGLVEAGYRPESGAATTVAQVARAAGGAAFSAGDLGAAGAALEAAADVGPSSAVGVAETTRSLAPVFAGLGLLCIALSLLRPHRRIVRELFTTGERRYDAPAGT
jgi:hypothetical protein